MDKHPLQLYSLGTPNDQKVTTMLEELLVLGVTGAEYGAWLIRIGDGDQLSGGFVEVSPNSRIPALHDHTHNPPIRMFESGSILLYLVRKFGYFLSRDLAKRAETMGWLFRLQGAAPFFGSGFGHSYHYTSVKIEYTINRFIMEAKRLFDVLDKQLVQRKFAAGDEYTIVDMAIWSWSGNVMLGSIYDTAKFPGAGSYKHAQCQAREVGERLAVKRRRIVNHIGGPLNEQLHGRHDASDLGTNTEYKRQG